MSCRGVLEDEYGLRAFMESATRGQAWDAVYVLRDLMMANRAQHSQSTTARLRRQFDRAEALYVEKFGEEWLPF